MCFIEVLSLRVLYDYKCQLFCVQFQCWEVETPFESYNGDLLISTPISDMMIMSYLYASKGLACLS